MKEIFKGKTLTIQSYKHNKQFHRLWRQSTVIDYNIDSIIMGSYKTKVIEHGGRNWITQEPTITFFYKKSWFNIIAMLRKDGIYYYCNLSSPYLIDEEALKYIDYDLDVKVMPDFDYQILDRNEFERHIKKFNYPPKLVSIIESELKKLLNMIENRLIPFNHQYIQEQYKKLMISYER